MKNTKIISATSLKNLDSVINANRPKGGANLTEHGFMFGDPFDDDDELPYGDLDPYGDIDPYGDLDMEDGDIDTMAAYDVLSGGPKGRKILKRGALVAGAGAAGYGTYKLIQAIKRRKMKKNLAIAQGRQIGRMNRALTGAFGKIGKSQLIPFIQVSGAKINAAPIALDSKFPASDWKLMLDKQAVETPFLQETVAGVFGGVFWTATSVGVVQPRLFSTIFAQIGTNALAGVPSSIIRVTCTIPLITGGVLVIATEPFLLTFSKGFDVKLQITPWLLVTNKPMPILGQYDAANPVIVTIEGLPATSALSLVIPGSLHPWTVTMRNALI